MKALIHQFTTRFVLRDCTLIVSLSLLLTFVAGCAPMLKGPDRGPATGAVVSRLDDGRQGFRIEESAGVNAETGSDFASAVDLIEQARYDKAIVLLEQVIERAPGLTAPRINIALAYQQKGETDSAEKQLRTALELIPGHPVASNVYGLLLRKNGRFAEARKIFASSLQRFPEYLPVRKNLGILCELYLGDPACALQHYEIYSEAAPADEQVRTWIASLHQRLESRE